MPATPGPEWSSTYATGPAIRGDSGLLGRRRRGSGGLVETSQQPPVAAFDLTSPGLLLGLLAPKRGAPGQSLLTTMLNTMGHCMSEDLLEYEGRPPLDEVDSAILGLHALYRMYQAEDGWVFLACLTDRDWERLSTALGPEIGALAGESRLATAEGRRAEDNVIRMSLSAVFQNRPAREWEADLTAAGVACVEVAPGRPMRVSSPGHENITVATGATGRCPA